MKVNEIKDSGKGKKTPNPTNFSNSRTSTYLPFDRVLFDSYNQVAKPPSDFMRLSEVTFTDMTEESIVQINIPMIFPLSTKATSEKKAFEENKMKGPLHIQTMKKLQPKQLPTNNESLIDISIITNGRESHTIDKQLLCKEETIREVKPLADIINTYGTENSNKAKQIKSLNNEATVISVVTVGSKKYRYKDTEGYTRVL